MGGVVNVFGRSEVGSTALAVLIPPKRVGSRDGALITDFGASVKDPGSDTKSVFYLEVSADEFVADVRPVSAIEITRSGTVYKTYGNNPSTYIRVKANEEFRVRYKQDVASRVTAEVLGRTQHNDIVSY